MSTSNTNSVSETSETLPPIFAPLHDLNVFSFRIMISTLYTGNVFFPYFTGNATEPFVSVISAGRGLVICRRFSGRPWVIKPQNNPKWDLRYDVYCSVKQKGRTSRPHTINYSLSSTHLLQPWLMFRKNCITPLTYSCGNSAAKLQYHNPDTCSRRLIFHRG